MSVMSRAELSRAEQRLTPDVVQAFSFRAARLGRRGFDEEHVRAFCHQVQAELAALLSERATLQTEVGRLRRRVLGQVGEDDASRYGREDAHLQAVSILARAQQTADHYVAEAQEYSRHLAQDARRRRDEILGEAREHADQMMQEAHREASYAAQTAMAAAPAAEPHPDHREMEAELAYLRTFSDVYRTNLRAYLDALLRNVDEWEHADRSPVSPVPPVPPVASVPAARPDVPPLTPPGAP